jgi:5-methylcytosine-specific restriction endonuclease McrA
MSDAEKAADRDRKREKSTANYRRRWEQEHPGVTWEQHLRERAERKATERARITEKAREYWEANRDTINAKKRQDRLDNPGRESRASKEWRKNNKEKGRHAVRRRRARRKGAGGSHTVEDVRAIVAMQTPAGKRNPRCWWCDEEIGGTYHVDHRIPLAKGGGDEPGNLVIACPRCNLSKHTRMPHEFAGRLL